MVFHPDSQGFHFKQLVADESLQVMDEDTKSKLCSAGSIVVHFHRVSSWRNSPYTDHGYTLPDHGVVPEKTLNGTSLSHVVSLDPLRPAPQQRGTSHDRLALTYVDGILSLFAKVHFEYRSLDVLKMMDLLPRDGLDDRPVKIEDDADNTIKNGEDLENDAEQDMQIKEEPVYEDVRAGEEPVEEDIHIKEEEDEEEVIFVSDGRVGGKSRGQK